MMDARQTENGQTHEVRQYVTFINGKMVCIVLHAYQGTMTSDQKSLLLSVVDNVVFTSVTQKPSGKSSLDWSSIGSSALSGALIAVAVGGVAMLVRQFRKRKEEDPGNAKSR